MLICGVVLMGCPMIDPIDPMCDDCDSFLGDDLETNNGYAPEYLPQNYMFQVVEGNSTERNGILYWINNESQGSHRSSKNNGTIPRTSYSYRKTGQNTATFSFSCQQVNPNRIYNYSGTLTYSSKDACEYNYDYQYAGATERKKLKFKVYIGDPKTMTWKGI